MSNNSPYVILDLQAFSYNDTSEENNFYRCKTGKNIINYSKRESATAQSPQEQELAEAKSELGLGGSKGGSIAGYMKDRTGSTGLFGENGELSNKDVASFTKELQNTKSNVWTAVLSFTPEIASQVCSNKMQAQELLSEHISSLWKGSHVDPTNIAWFGSFHTNTDNPHIHFVMYEKKPLHLSSKGDASFSNKLVIPKENLTRLKYNLVKGLENGAEPFLHLRDETRKGLALNLNNDKFKLTSIYTQNKDIIENGHFQYKRLTPKQQQKIDRQVKSIIFSDPTLKLKYEQYKNYLRDTQSHILKIHEHNNSIPTKESANFYASRVGEFKNRLGNELLNTLKSVCQQREPYLLYKNQLLSQSKELGYARPNIKNSMLMRKKTMLDMSMRCASDLLKSLTTNIASNMSTLSDELYKHNKKKRGEYVVE